VETIVDKVVHKKSPPAPVMSMDLVRVSKDNLGQWARQLKDWGFTDVPDKYLKM
jgi:ribose transport system substrate-binding protein